MNIIGNYQILLEKVLGKGSFSTVYLGKCIDNSKIKDEYVAIKKIDRTNTNIRNEMKIVNILINNPHPNIVRFYDIIQDKDYIYIVMEYCSMGTLQSLLKGQMREKYVKMYMTDILEGLKHLLKHNIYHQDLKPENILVTETRYSLKITDFGLANINNGSRKKKISFSTCGSPLYMAPEILNKNISSYDSTIWAYGMIMFELYYGYHPYSHCKNIDELVDELYDNPIQIPYELNPTITKEGLSLLERLLSSELYKRITWNELIKDKWLNNNTVENTDCIKSSSFGNIKDDDSDELLFELE